jgi:trigger factor
VPNIEIFDEEKNQKKISINVPPEDIEKEFQEFYKEISKYAKIPGFRKGKIPPQLLELNFKETAKEEIFKNVISKNYSEALKQSDITPISEPHIDADIKNLDRGKSFKFEIKIIPKPEIKLAEYKKILLEKKKVRIKEEDIDKIVEHEREKNAELLPVEGRDVIRDKDIILADIEGVVNNSPIKKQENTFIEIGTGKFPQPVEKGLIGMKTGEKRTINISASDIEKEKNKFPSTLANSSFTITAKDIRKKRLLIVNDEFAKGLGNFNSLEELRRDIKLRLEKESEIEINKDLEDQTHDYLVKNTKLEVPALFVERQIQFLKSIQGKAADDNKLKSLAENQVKYSLIIEEIAEKESIEVKNEEIETEIKKLPFDKKNSQYQYWNSDKGKNEIKYIMLKNKVTKFIIENANIKEKRESLIITPDDDRKQRTEDR